MYAILDEESNANDDDGPKRKKLKKEPLKLIQYCKTRWDSAYDMLERLNFLRWCVCAVLSDTNFTKKADAKNLGLKDHQWHIIEEILPTLLLLKITNKVFCGESYTTLSDVLFTLHNLLSKLNENPSDSSVLAKLKSDLTKNIKDRFFNNIDFTTSHHVKAMALDPRYKHLKQFDPLSRDLAYASIERELLDMEDSKNLPSGLLIVNKSVAINDIPKNEDALLFGDDELEDAVTQLPEYKEFLNLSQKNLSRNTDILKWWKDHETLFPNVAKLAKRYLCIPCTSVASERHFSAAGRVVTKSRNRLDPSTISDLLLVNQNSSYNNNTS